MVLIQNTLLTVNHGYIWYATGNGTTGRYGEPAMLRLFLADGTDADFEVDKDLDNGIFATGATWDGTKITTGAIVEYGLDKDGVIEALTVAAIAKVTTGAFDVDDVDVTKAGYMDGWKINSDAIVFTVKDFTKDLDDPDNYGVLEGKDIYGAKGVSAFYNEEDGFIDLVVMADETGSDEDDVYALYGSSKSVLSDDEFDVSLFIDGEKDTYVTKKGTIHDGVTEHAIYLVDFDGTGKVKGLKAVSFGALTTADDIGAFGVTSDSGVYISVKDDVLTVLTGTAIAGKGTLADKSTVVGQSVSLAKGKDLVVYKLVDGKWAVKGKSELTMKGDDFKVYFLDLHGEDKVVDTVLILPADVSLNTAQDLK